MSQKDKVLDILSLASLPEDAKIARLASQKVGQVFTLEHAKAVVRVFFGDEVRGRTKEVTQKLFDEKHRQERLRNDRQAIKRSLRQLAAPYTERFRADIFGVESEDHRRSEHIRHAQNIFGRDIETNFGDDNLALMALIHGDIRRYTVTWLDGASRPRPSAVVEVGVRVDGIRHGQHRILLYRHEGRTMVAATDADTVRDAFGDQVPTKLVELAQTLKEQGCTIATDFGSQEMVVRTPEGDEKRLPWRGRTVDQ